MIENLVVYDIETYKGCFLFAVKLPQENTPRVYEVSNRRNDTNALLDFLKAIKDRKMQMVGFNNIGFDYPITHEFMNNPWTFSALKAYEMAQAIITNQEKFNPYQIRFSDRHIPQIDLQRIWHFNNQARRTRLKDLEVCMRSEVVDDLPYPFDSDLTFDQIDRLIEYNKHDVMETLKFLHYSLPKIEMRKNLITEGVLRGDVLNYDDVKIGTEYFISKLGRENCFMDGKPIQSIRKEVRFKDIILPKISFETEEFNDVLREFSLKKSVIGDTDANKSVPFQRTFRGLKFFYGSGGLHASREAEVFHSTHEDIVVDIDVEGMYPAVGTANGFYPEHLGKRFVEVYKQMQLDRKQYDKHHVMNATLKLANNGAYGKSNDVYSPIYDPKYMFSVTINGQLQLSQLAEQIMKVPDLKIIQVNTDGITLIMPRKHKWLFDFYKSAWENETHLKLEENYYRSMYIRDVNNYIAVGMNGSVKRKGAYWYAETMDDYNAGPGAWHKDHSNVIARKLADLYMTKGFEPKDMIRLSQNPYDFMLRQKVRGSDKCFIGTTQTQRTLRYYVTTDGEPMAVRREAKGPVGEYKRKNGVTDRVFQSVLSEIGLGLWDERIHTKNKSKYEVRESSVVKGFLVSDCSDVKAFDWSRVNYDYYLEETEKLIIRG